MNFEQTFVDDVFLGDAYTAWDESDEGTIVNPEVLGVGAVALHGRLPVGTVALVCAREEEGNLRNFLRHPSVARPFMGNFVARPSTQAAIWQIPRGVLWLRPGDVVRFGAEISRISLWIGTPNYLNSGTANLAEPLLRLWRGPQPPVLAPSFDLAPLTRSASAESVAPSANGNLSSINNLSWCTWDSQTKRVRLQKQQASSESAEIWWLKSGYAGWVHDTADDWTPTGLGSTGVETYDVNGFVGVVKVGGEDLYIDMIP